MKTDTNAGDSTSRFSGSPSVEQWLIEENKQLRIAGCKMAEASLRVVREYDGLHRLMLAVSEWSKAIADEGRRGKANAQAHSERTE